MRLQPGAHLTPTNGATEDYWDLYSDLLEQVKEAFDRSGIEMTYNHLNVHMMDK